MAGDFLTKFCQGSSHGGDADSLEGSMFLIKGKN
jgi:hypothetical protein